eukprot:NODE_7899_length_1541_cov_2.890382.p2 GENE.NODE_7899_length_1541_cov_2.890382~~NODE_7899_length_1541_cov_2.890382.p2  ORF type:complete len:298 (+),score=92.87 NODE_7899_length_1541_cov_2.890382:442-1335(+)
MERVGLRSGWPHPSHLYRQLCGKLWIPAMSLNREYHVPPTTRVHYADVRTDAWRAAEQAIGQLRAIHREVWGAERKATEELAGVVKLGFSWQGDDVLPFRGIDNLVRVLMRLAEQRSSQQVLCLVQQMVPDVVCEYRLLLFCGSGGSHVRESLWLKLKEKGQHHAHQVACEVADFALTSAHVVTREHALRAFFGGNVRACEQVEADAARLAERWLLWFTAECADPPASTRLDFLVSHRAGSAPEVWTCEVGECGASLCSVECDARNAAVLNWAVRHDPTGRFPLPLPAITRNSGWKS